MNKDIIRRTIQDNDKVEGENSRVIKIHDDMQAKFNP